MSWSIEFDEPIEQTAATLREAGEHRANCELLACNQGRIYLICR
jgi:hypothetical protein